MVSSQARKLVAWRERDSMACLELGGLPKRGQWIGFKKSPRQVVSVWPTAMITEFLVSGISHFAGSCRSDDSEHF